jgi:isopentenyldiphosphate isomerase
MADRIDVLSAAGLRTGEILPRREIHRLGKLHRAVHLYLFNAKNELLLQQRALTVDQALTHDLLYSGGSFRVAETLYVYLRK